MDTDVRTYYFVSDIGISPTGKSSSPPEPLKRKSRPLFRHQKRYWGSSFKIGKRPSRPVGRIHHLAVPKVVSVTDYIAQAGI